MRAEVLARTEVDLSHSQCLEIVARRFGVDSWNVLAARTGSGDGQISRPGATLQLTEHRYEPGPGATVDIWIAGLDGYHQELFAKDLGVFGPALGVPPIAETHWGARVLTMPDPAS